MPVVMCRILEFKWALHKSMIHTLDIQHYECHTVLFICVCVCVYITFVTKELLIASTKTLSSECEIVAVDVIPYMGYLVGIVHCCLLHIT